MRAAKRKAERDLSGLLDVALAGGSAAALAAVMYEAQSRVDAVPASLAVCAGGRKTVDRAGIEATIRNVGASVLRAATAEERKQRYNEISLSPRYDPTDRMVYGECAPCLSSSCAGVGGGT